MWLRRSCVVVLSNLAPPFLSSSGTSRAPVPHLARACTRDSIGSPATSLARYFHFLSLFYSMPLTLSLANARLISSKCNWNKWFSTDTLLIFCLFTRLNVTQDALDTFDDLSLAWVISSLSSADYFPMLLLFSILSFCCSEI